jgi:thiol:disulfide interchange protein
MTRVVTTISIGLLALAVGAYAAVDWAQDYKSATARAAKEKKLLMVDLYADWCGPCRMLDKTTFRNADVQAALSRDFIAVKVNIESNSENRALASKLDTRAIPHIVFFDSDGKKLSDLIGYYSPDQFLDELRKVAKQAAKK